MPNLASIMKSEIMRLARKEIRSEVGSLRKASANHRAEIIALKRRLEQIERLSSRAAKAAAKHQGDPLQTGEERKLRFSAKRFASIRKKLGLSAGDLGLLIGVSAQTIYNWEAEKSRPRQAQLAAIATLRGIGKREAKRRLEALAAQESAQE